MPWSHTAPMDQNTPFIADDLRDRLSMIERCTLYGVSRKTEDTWVDRSLTHGPQGLEERSRRPRTSPRHTPDDVVAAILCQRPHEALDKHTPAARDEPSSRQMPNRLPPLDDPDRFEAHDVRATGGIRWYHPWVYVSHTCMGEYIGLEDIDDGTWHVAFGPLALGRRLERHRRIADASGRPTRHR